MIAAAAATAAGDDRLKSSSDSKAIANLLESTKREREIASNPSLNRRMLRRTPSAPTIRKAVKAVAPVGAEVTMSSDARAAALADLKNPIAFAAVLKHVQDIDSKLLFSTDGVHLVLGDKIGEKVKVNMAQNSKDWFRSHGFSASSGRRKKQCRILPLIITHSADAEVTTVACIVKDEAFRGQKVAAYPINSKLSVWLVPPGYDTQRFFDCYTRKFLFPCINEIRRQMEAAPCLDVVTIPVPLSSPEVAEDADADGPDLEVEVEDGAIEYDEDDSGAEGYDEDDDPAEDHVAPAAAAAAAAPVAAAAAVAPKQRAAMTMDGDYPQTQAALQQAFVDNCKEENIEVFKLCASCSLAQAPADVGPQHSCLHRFFSAEARRDHDGVPSREMAHFLTHIFDKTKIPAESRKVFRRCLTHVESALSTSLSRSNLLLGWRRSGLVPWNLDVIFSKWAGFKELTDDEVTKLYAAMPDLYQYTLAEGQTTEAELDRVLTLHGLDVAKFNAFAAAAAPHDRRSKPKDERVVNQQRAVWLNSDGYRKTLLAKQLAEQALVAGAVAAKAAATAKKLQDEADRSAKKEEAAAKKAAKQAEKQAVAEAKVRVSVWLCIRVFVDVN